MLFFFHSLDIHTSIFCTSLFWLNHLQSHPSWITVSPCIQFSSSLETIKAISKSTCFLRLFTVLKLLSQIFYTFLFSLFSIVLHAFYYVQHFGQPCCFKMCSINTSVDMTWLRKCRLKWSTQSCRCLCGLTVAVFVGLRFFPWPRIPTQSLTRCSLASPLVMFCLFRCWGYRVLEPAAAWPQSAHLTFTVSEWTVKWPGSSSCCRPWSNVLVSCYLLSPQTCTESNTTSLLHLLAILRMG